MQKHTRLCYILPDYNFKTDSHFFHLYEFLERASKKLDIFLIIERSSSDKKDIRSVMPDIKFIYIQKLKFIPFRFIESFVAVLIARIKGYKNFYTHYCYIGGTNAAIVSGILGGKSYYWNCAMNWLFKKRDSSKIGYELCLKLSHYLITGSEGMKHGYAEHYQLNPDKIIVMPNWINLNRFKRRSTQIESRQVGNTQINAEHQRESAYPERDSHRVSAKLPKVILFVHWLSKRKGADMIIPIVKHLNQNFRLKTSSYKILVVGNGPYEEDLLEGIKENSLEKYIEVIGGIPHEEVIKYYAKADIFIMPSMEEGFPRVLLEAMSMGVPYIASDVGAVRELSPETAQRFLVKPGDVEMFAHKLEALMSDEKIYEDFKQEELQKIKEYSIDKVIDIFVKLFK